MCKYYAPSLPFLTIERMDLSDTKQKEKGNENERIKFLRSTVRKVGNKMKMLFHIFSQNLITRQSTLRRRTCKRNNVIYLYTYKNRRTDKNFEK